MSNWLFSACLEDFVYLIIIPNVLEMNVGCQLEKFLNFYLSYFSSLGSQSSPGRSSRAVCLTSSLSTNKLRRCSAWTMATRIHSISGGRSRKGLGMAMEKGRNCFSFQSIYAINTETFFYFSVIECGLEWIYYLHTLCSHSDAQVNMYLCVCAHV